MTHIETKLSREGLFQLFDYVPCICIIIEISTLGDSGDFQTSRYQGIGKATASGVFEDLKFKISEGSDQN